ncbi:putative reverse transcriptase domain-containing protein [Tanacetum coccineum]
MESVHDMSGCSVDQKLKYTSGSFVGKALTLWNSQIRMLSREVAISMSWNDFKFMMIQEFCPSHEMQKIERYVYGFAPHIDGMVAATEPKTIQKAVQISGALTDEAVRNGSIKKVEKRGNVGESSKDKNSRDDNKRTRTGGPCRTCFNCNRPSHLAKDCRGVPRNVNPVNARNPTVRACYECGSTDHVRSAWPRLNRAQGLEENRLNQVAANNEIEFRIELTPRATPVEKSPYRLAPLNGGVVRTTQGTPRTTENKTVDQLRIVIRSPRIDDLFDQLQGSQFFSKIDLRGKHVRTFIEVQFLGHVINGNGIHVDPSKIKAVKNWKAPRTLTRGSFILRMTGVIDRVKPKRVRAMNMILQSSIKDRILAAQKEAVDEVAVLQKGLDEMIEQRSDGTLYYLDQIWVPLKGEVRTMIMDEAHKSKYSVRPGADKMYYDLRNRLRYEHHIGHLACSNNLRFMYGNGKVIAMDFVTKLPRTSSGHDTIWVIVDRLTKSAHFLPMREDYKMERLARLYLNEIVARHGVLDPNISGCDSHMEDILKCASWTSKELDVHLPLVEFLYNNSYHSSVRCAPFEALYGRKCRSPIMWAEVGEGQLIGPELFYETTERYRRIKDRTYVVDWKGVGNAFGMYGILAPGDWTVDIIEK